MTPVRRWFAFATVGALGFVVQTLALVLMTRGAGAHYLVATAGAVEIAVLHNFLWHERWTWRDRPALGRRQRLARLATFNLTNGLVSIAGNLIFVFLLVRAFGSNVIVANLASMTVTAVLNYLAGDRVVFATPRWARLRGTAARAGLVALLLVAATTTVSAAALKPETIAAFNEYARALEARINEQRQAGRPAVQPPDRLDGQGDAVDGDTVKVPSGLIHHWRGRILLPGATLERVLEAIDAPDRIAKRQEDVLAARVLERHGSRMWLFLKVTRKSLLTVTFNTEYEIDVQRDSTRSARSRSVATRIVELEDAGTPQEREKPEGRDWGLLWRLNAYWRYTEVDAGVVAELETISLSRDIPPGLGLIARPIIEREARQSIVKTLVALRAELTLPD